MITSHFWSRWPMCPLSYCCFLCENDLYAVHAAPCCGTWSFCMWLKWDGSCPVIVHIANPCFYIVHLELISLPMISHFRPLFGSRRTMSTVKLVWTACKWKVPSFDLFWHEWSVNMWSREFSHLVWGILLIFVYFYYLCTFNYFCFESRHCEVLILYKEYRILKL